MSAILPSPTGVRVGRPSYILVQARDSEGYDVPAADEQFRFTCEGGACPHADTQWIYRGAGLYEYRFTPAVATDHTAQAELAQNGFWNPIEFGIISLEVDQGTLPWEPCGARTLPLWLVVASGDRVWGAHGTLDSVVVNLAQTVLFSDPSSGSHSRNTLPRLLSVQLVTTDGVPIRAALDNVTLVVTPNAGSYTTARGEGASYEFFFTPAVSGLYTLQFLVNDVLLPESITTWSQGMCVLGCGRCTM